MTAEVFNFPGDGERDPQAILQLAKQANLKSVIVLAYDQEGFLYKSTSFEHMSDFSWLLTKAQWWMKDYCR
jgi:hypothetical protein